MDFSKFVRVPAQPGLHYRGGCGKPAQRCSCARPLQMPAQAPLIRPAVPLRAGEGQQSWLERTRPVWRWGIRAWRGSAFPQIQRSPMWTASPQMCPNPHDERHCHSTRSSRLTLSLNWGGGGAQGGGPAPPPGGPQGHLCKDQTNMMIQAHQKNVVDGFDGLRLCRSAGPDLWQQNRVRHIWPRRLDG